MKFRQAVIRTKDQAVIKVDGSDLSMNTVGDMVLITDIFHTEDTNYAGEEIYKRRVVASAHSPVIVTLGEPGEL